VLAQTSDEVSELDQTIETLDQTINSEADCISQNIEERIIDVAAQQKMTEMEETTSIADDETDEFDTFLAHLEQVEIVKPSRQPLTPIVPRAAMTVITPQTSSENIDTPNANRSPLWERKAGTKTNRSTNIWDKENEPVGGLSSSPKKLKMTLTPPSVRRQASVIM